VLIVIGSVLTPIAVIGFWASSEVTPMVAAPRPRVEV